MSSNTQQKAIQLLQDSSLFHDASPELLEALSSKMIPMEVEEGHIFIEERTEIHCVMILEEGVLQRTKLSVESNQQFDTLQSSLRIVPTASRTKTLQDTSVLVDKITGRGRVTGLLHCFQEGNMAFATVSASTAAKVWLISGEDLRATISTTPQFALDVMALLSRELRHGSKSLRKLMERAGGKTRKSSSGDDDQDEQEDGYQKHSLKVLCYDATSWVQEGFEPALREFNQKQLESEDGDNKKYQIEMEYTTERLSEQSATYAAGYDAVCLFVNDTANASVLQTLSLFKVNMIAMRCAGFDRVDTKAARAFGHTVARVPAYSPYAVAEMAVTLLMAVNRKVNLAGQRVKMANFTLDAGLMGMDVHGKTVGVMGTGKIGQILCQIMLGFGCKLLVYDVFENQAVKDAGGTYVTKDEIMAQSDILFLMMPLLPATKHTINNETVQQLKKGVILINTSRGGLVDTSALLQGLRSGRIGGVGMDVYENEQAYFFQDWSARQVQDPDLVALLGQNNVVLTAHQAFFTKEAVNKIVSTTIDNLHNYQKGMMGQLHPNNCIPALKEDS